MLTDICCKEIEGLYRTPIVQQTAFWSAVKNKLGSGTLAVNFKARKQDLYTNVETDGIVNSDVLVILQHLNQIDCIAYVPYGPELEPFEEYQGPFLEDLSESLRSFLPKNCILIRYDLCWESYWAKQETRFGAEGHWWGEPEKQAKELRFNINTVNWNFKKAHFNILPSNTIYLNLQPELDTILGRMKPKTRYNIGLSAKKGVVVHSAGMESIHLWYDLYRETALRNRILLNELKYFEAILTARAENSSSPAEVQLLIAELDQEPLAAMFLIITGHRGSYLYGASSDYHRNCMATYALQWAAIRISKAKACTEYDMFGISPAPDPAHPLYGLFKFKSGFGGDLYHSLGCWDYPLDAVRYEQFRSQELSWKGFHAG